MKRSSNFCSHNRDVALTPSDKLLPRCCTREGLRLRKDTAEKSGEVETLFILLKEGILPL